MKPQVAGDREQAPSGEVGAAAAAILDTVPVAMRALRSRMRANRGGLSVPQFRAMMFVRRNPGSSLSQIAEHLGTSVPAASELVSRLVAQGLVIRVTDPMERRRIRLTLSDDGRRDLELARSGTEAWLAGLLAGLDGAARRRLEAGLLELKALIGGADADHGEPGRES